MSIANNRFESSEPNLDVACGVYSLKHAAFLA
jgi:hypothetical protein